MIPSRPLSLIEIITETFALYGRMFGRYALLALLFVAPGVILVTYGLASFTEDAIVSARHDINFNDNDFTAARDEMNDWIATQNPLFAPPELSHPKHDSTTTPADSLAHARVGDAHQIVYYLRTNAARFSAPILIAVFGALLLLIGIFALVSATIELSCQAFEEREWDVRDTLRNTLLRNTWKLLFLYCIYTLISIAINRVLIMMDAGIAGPLSVFLTFAQLSIVVRCAAMFPAIVSEELGPLAGLRRSWELTRGSGARMLIAAIMFALILFILAMIVSIVTGLPFGSVLSWWQAWSTNEHVTVAWFSQTFPGLLAAAAAWTALTFLLLFALGPIFITVFYYDMRTRREGPLTYVE